MFNMPLEGGLIPNSVNHKILKLDLMEKYEITEHKN